MFRPSVLMVIYLIFIALLSVTVDLSLASEKGVKLDESNVDKKAVLTRPLDQGIYNFEPDGFVPKVPLKRLRGVHSEMINTLRSVNDPAKLLRYLLSIGNTVQEDMQMLRQKLKNANFEDGKKIDKKSLKADAFVFLAGHASLISHLVMYFPDVMKRLFKKNPGFEDDVKWVLRFTSNARLVNEEKTVEILHLAQQEMELIPRESDFHNPYRLENLLQQDDQTPKVTTKKPRKRLKRGPRLADGEL